MKCILNSAKRINPKYFWKYVAWGGCAFFFAMLIDLQSGKDIFIETTPIAIEGNPKFYTSKEDENHDKE